MSNHSARLDYDLIVVEFERRMKSIAPDAIGAIVFEPDEYQMRVRINNHNGRSHAWFDFDTEEEARAYHGVLHNLWRDARIVAGRSK